MKVFEEHDREEWNRIVSNQPVCGLLQSWEWGEFKESLGWKVFRISIRNEDQILSGAQLLIKPMIYGSTSVAYIPRGPIGDWLAEDVFYALFYEIHRIARRHRAAFLKVEPPLGNDALFDKIMKQNQFVPGPYPNQPLSTIVVDLVQDLDHIPKQFGLTTRQRIRSSVQQGVIVRMGTIEDLPSFYEMMRITGRREKFAVRSREYYEKQWLSFDGKDQRALFLAYERDRLIAVHMTFRFGDQAAFLHGASIFDSKKLHPNHLLVWEGIKWAKDLGCKSYDLWGIPAEVGRTAEGADQISLNRTDGLWGVYQFKRGFSKNVVNFLGSYDYVYDPLLYRAMTNSFINSFTLDRLSSWADSIWKG